MTSIHLLIAHGIDMDTPNTNVPYIDDCHGIDELLKLITPTVKSTDRLAIVCDVNTDPEARLSTLRQQLKEAGVSLKDGPDILPIIFDGLFTGQKIGVWLMPDNCSPGALEDFLTKLVPEHDPCWDHAKSATADAKVLGAPYRNAHRTKAELHTWLAWQDEPGYPFGTAIKATCFDAQRPEAITFVNWLKVLFELA